MSRMPVDASRRVAVTRVRPAGRTRDRDVAATEEPLEIRLHGQPFAVIMRTPGADRELAAGFLLSERIIASAGDLAVIEHCLGPEHPDRRNVVNVSLLGREVDELLAGRRRILTSSACGLCGRVTIESLRAEAPAITASWTLDPADVVQLPGWLRERQSLFAATGGLHAAGLFDRGGEALTVAEDVGRHNAVDKVIGRMLLLEELPLSSSILFVSGRASFEIVQKAFLAGVPVVGAVSAPSSLAIDLARDAGITLLGFVRDGAFNVYTHSQRIGESSR